MIIERPDMKARLGDAAPQDGTVPDRRPSPGLKFFGSAEWMPSGTDQDGRPRRDAPCHHGR